MWEGKIFVDQCTAVPAVPGPTARNMWHQVDSDPDSPVGCGNMMTKFIGHSQWNPRSEQKNANVKGDRHEVQNT